MDFELTTSDHVIDGPFAQAVVIGDLSDGPPSWHLVTWLKVNWLREEDVRGPSGRSPDDANRSLAEGHVRLAGFDVLLGELQAADRLGEFAQIEAARVLRFVAVEIPLLDRDGPDGPPRSK